MIILFLFLYNIVMINQIVIKGHQDLKTYILDREPDLIALMRGENKSETLQRASQLNCADITYLLASDIKAQTNGVEEIFALDGRGPGLTEADGHLILGVRTSEGLSSVDGTIWQVFPDEEHSSIMGPFQKEEELLATLCQKYGGGMAKNYCT